MKTIAVVVTHNRSSKLEKCLTAIGEATLRPDGIVIVDNNSSDGTNEVISDFKHVYAALMEVTVIKLASNIGGAGGFELGMRKAYELGADLFWLMDDDCYVSESALEALLLSYEKLELNQSKKIGFLASKVNWKDGTVCEMNQPSIDWNFLYPYDLENPYIKVIGASFVSCLFPRHAVDVVGFPHGQFFIWFDDAEYTRRISEHFNCYCVLDSSVTHDTERNEGVWFGNIHQYNCGKFYFGARNESWYWFNRKSIFDWLLFIVHRSREMKAGNIKWHFRSRIYKQILIGALGRFMK